MNDSKSIFCCLAQKIINLSLNFKELYQNNIYFREKKKTNEKIFLILLGDLGKEKKVNNQSISIINCLKWKEIRTFN